MDILEILKALEEKLSGNMEQDFKFLIKEANHFKELGLLEISTEVIKLFEKHYGDEGKKYIVDVAKESFKKRRDMFKEVIELEKNNDFQKAQELTVKLIDTFPINRPLKENQILLSFNNLFEHIYFETHFNQTRKQVLRLEEPYSSYYFHLAYQLFYLEDYEETIKMLDVSLKYNPVQIDAVILKGESYYKLGNIEQFFNQMEIALQNAYNRFQLANCYYLLARYFNDISDKKTASTCALLSKNFVVSEQINKVIAQINELPGTNVNPNDVNELRAILDARKIQFGPSVKVLQTLKKIVSDEKTKTNPNLLKYFLSILYELSNDPAVKEQLDKINVEK